MVLANPPFGKKSSITHVGQTATSRMVTWPSHGPDFWATTSNKQLTFVQSVVRMLKIKGSASVVLPDSISSKGS